MTMLRLVPVALLVAWGCATACAGEAGGPPTRTRCRLWMAPVYLVVGLPRDVLDAPSKALSSIPVLNRVLICPLAILNGVTTVASWSFTRHGIDGGFEAWVACLRLPRQGEKELPASLRNRPWWRNYAPNWRSLVIVTGE